MPPNVFSVKTGFVALPLRLVLNQASDLALHGVLDVAGGVEAYGSVVSCADHLTLVVDVGGCDKRLSSLVVRCAYWFVFLQVKGGCRYTFF